MSESKTALKKAAKREALTEKRQSHEVHQTAQARSLLGVLRTVAEAVPALSVTLPSLELSKGKGRGAPVDPELAARAEAALSGVASLLRGDSVPYRALPRAFHSQGLDVLATMVHRPSKYQDKFLAQELSLLGKVWAIAGGGGADLAVVDIGAGNGCLALIASLTLDAQAVLVDHTLPREELRVESRIPDEYHQRILRITRDIEDMDLARDLLPFLESHGIRRAVVVAKHLCGVGTDLALSFAGRWMDTNSSVVLQGAVIATCCGHKISHTENLDRYCQLYANDVHLTHLTHSCDADSGARARSLVSVCARHVAWRTTAGCATSVISDGQVQAAELFEDLLQKPRLALLRRLFPAAQEVVFVPQENSLQNRCLLAGSASAVEAACLPSPGFLESLCAAQDKVRASIGHFDLRPRGLASARFEYDGQ